jgi:metal-responsive CopG/Arc/MetJ family transcriptional regulator
MSMATRKITFTLPEDLAEQFMRCVPPRERSRYVAEALRAKLSRDRSLRRACIIANNNPDVQAIEREFDAI